MSQDLEDIRPKGSGNATVPEDAPIQPPQAFVDAMVSFFPLVFSQSGNVAGNIANIGATSVAAYFEGLYNEAGGLIQISASGNAIPTSEVDSILAFYNLHKLDTGWFGTKVIDVSGGTSGPPTDGISTADADATIIVTGTGEPEANRRYCKTGTVNGKGIYASPSESYYTFTWDGTKWVFADTEDDEWRYESEEDTDYPFQATTWVKVVGDDPIPTVSKGPQMNQDEQALVTSNAQILTN